MNIIKIEQNSQEWQDLRKGKITGTKFKDIVVKRGDSKKKGFYQLLADRLSIEEEGEAENPMERGHRLEKEAIDLFQEQTGKKVDRDVFCISDKNKNIALSPDGLVGKDEAVEVKCLNSASHLQALLEKTIPKDYEEQRNQYFVVNKDLKKLYFIFYDPRVTIKPIHWITVNREDIADDIEFQENYQIKVLKEIDELLANLAF